MNFLDDAAVSRRDLLKGAALGVAAVGLSAKDPKPAKGEPAASMIDVPFEARPVVRLGIVGTGKRGRSLLRDFLAVDGVEVKALCDLQPEHAAKAAAMVEKAGQKRPELYTGSVKAYEKLCERQDLDFVIVATPWEWHTQPALHAMRHGIHVGVEVPVANTLQELWDLVDTSEKTRRHCMILENCNYGHSEMIALQMCRKGALGDLTHGEAAYIHDLRSILYDFGSEGDWRRQHHFKRNGNLYPTHGLGPVCAYMDVLRGDALDYMVSVSSRERALSEYRDAKYGQDPKLGKETFTCGDISTSILKTRLGRTILLQHDVVSPRPYDRLNLISGTKGVFKDYPARVYFDGSKVHDFEPLEKYEKTFAHPLWTTVGEIARKKGGHGGMDYIMAYRIVECLRKGLVPDMDVYDAATWSAPTPLSEASVAQNGMPVKFPDFTRGRWKQKRATLSFA